MRLRPEVLRVAWCATERERDEVVFFEGNWSLNCGQPGAALGEHDEDVEEVLVVFGGGGEVAAYRAELCGSSEATQAAGHLLPQLDHAYVAFRAVVVGGLSG
jgi:hypothetical protein